MLDHESCKKYIIYITEISSLLDALIQNCSQRHTLDSEVAPSRLVTESTFVLSSVGDSRGMNDKPMRENIFLLDQDTLGCFEFRFALEPLDIIPLTRRSDFQDSFSILFHNHGFKTLYEGSEICRKLVVYDFFDQC